ncbi:MAG TPA: hypothetical protein VMV07_17655 [Streptosporangiaceae bacterium]|nr:hypothetical protein [Streptosporangiaceae bacterium]
MNAPTPADDIAETTARLEALAAELTARGWAARLHTPPGRPPSLHTHNPEPGAAALAEHVYAQPRADGTWAFWWPWAEPIAATPITAADIITRVLRARDAP